MVLLLNGMFENLGVFRINCTVQNKLYREENYKRWLTVEGTLVHFSRQPPPLAHFQSLLLPCQYLPMQTNTTGGVYRSGCIHQEGNTMGERKSEWQTE